MSISKTMGGAETGTVSDINAACNTARQFEDSGEFANAAHAMGEWWQGVGVRPNVSKLNAAQKGAVLSRVGALTGWLGSAQQIPESQDQAKNLIGEAADFFRSGKDLSNWAETRSDLAVCYWREGAFDKAREILEDVFGGKTELAPELEAKILLRSVNVDISTSQYARAMDTINKAFSLLRKSSNSLLLGKLYFHQALIFHLQGEDENRTDLLKLSLEGYNRASTYYKKAKHDRYIANAENNTGNVYRLLRQFADAHTHLDTSIKMYGKLKDKGGAAQVYDNKARAFIGQGKLSDAELAALTSVNLIREGGENAWLAESLTTLGVVLSRGGNFTEAASAFVEAKETALKVGDNESAGIAVLTQVEELQNNLTPAVVRSLFLEADMLLKNSPRIGTINRLQTVARKQFEIGDNENGAQPDSAKMAKLLSYADKLDSLFEDKDGQAFNWEDFSLPDAVREYEGEIILKALTETSGRVTKAALLLGLSHQNLSLILHQRHKDLKKYCVQRKPRTRPNAKNQ